MRTYKETLGIIKKANGLPLMGANAQGYSQAFIDAYNGGGFNQAPSFVQAPQQPGLSSLSTIGTYLPFLLGAGGLFGSSNTQTQPQPQPRKQVPAQTTQSTQPSQTSTFGQTAWNAAKWVGDKAMSLSPGMAGTLYNTGKTIYNNWDTIKDTAEKTWQGVKNLYSPVPTAQNSTAANQAVPHTAPSAVIEPAGYRPPVITDLNTASKVPRPQGLPVAPAAPKPLSPILGMYGLYKPPKMKQ